MREKWAKKRMRRLKRRRRKMRKWDSAPTVFWRRRAPAAAGPWRNTLIQFIVATGYIMYAYLFNVGVNKSEGWGERS